jgi:hypothetical protein
MSKIKLPKRVAGIKIPKSVRKGAVRDFLNSGAGQLVLAELVAIAAAAFAAKGVDARGAGEAAGRLSRAFHAALSAFREELRLDPEVVDSARADVMTAERTKKKSRESRSSMTRHH